MKKRVMPKEARKILGKVPAMKSFWLCINLELRSLPELSVALESIDDDVFRYHVSKDKNDFEAWIRDVLQDKELAREIARVKTKETLLRKIRERSEELRKTAKKGVKKQKKRIIRHKKKKARASKARKKARKPKKKQRRKKRR
ncbi:MAG: DUF5752 family protein [Candidatus Woesearchaeota archaeon]